MWVGKQNQGFHWGIPIFEKSVIYQNGDVNWLLWWESGAQRTGSMHKLGSYQGKGDNSVMRIGKVARKVM